MGKKKNKKSGARKSAAKITDPSTGSGARSESNTTKQLNETFGDTPLPDVPPDHTLAAYDTEKWKKDAKELAESWNDPDDFTMDGAPLQVQQAADEPASGPPEYHTPVYCKETPYLDDENPPAAPYNETPGDQSDSDEPLMNSRGPSSAPYEHIGPLPAGPSAQVGTANTVSTAADLIRQMFHRAIASEVCAGNMEGGSDRERELLELCEVCIANGWTVEELKARMLQNVPEEFREEMEGFVGMLLQLGPVDAHDFGLGKNSRKRG